MACATFIERHVKEVAKAEPEDALGPVLTQAAAYAGSGILKEFKDDVEQACSLCGNLGYDLAYVGRNWGSSSHQALLSKMYTKLKHL